jgi:uncharacterized protein (DUF2147 family)
MKIKTLFSVLLMAWSLTCQAQINAILGEWVTVDDKTGEQRSVVKLYKATDGMYYGKIAKLLVGKPDLVCDQCEGADHNRPIEGLVIIRGMQYDEKDNQLYGGRVLDPESGKFYYGKIYPKDGKLVLRGSLDKRGFIGRNQTWIRK